MNLIRVSAVVLAGGLLFSAFGVSAQILNEETDFGLPQFYGRGKNVSVMERERPDYQALGIDAVGFTFLPKVEIGTDYTDNLYAIARPTPGNPDPFMSPRSDIGFIVSPSITAQSNWGRHSLTVYANLKDETFADHPGEDQQAWTVQANGRVDVHGDSYINLGMDAEHDYVPRGSTNASTQTATPEPYYTEGVYFRGLYGGDRVHATLDGDYRNFSYQDVEQLNPGAPETPIAENLQDFTQGRIGGRVDYALTPDEALFTMVRYSNGDYLNNYACFLISSVNECVIEPKRNYNEVDVKGGANFDITALIRGEIGLGFVNRTYELGVYHGLSGLSASVKIEYFPTQLVTVTLTGQRLIQNAVDSTAGGYFENVATLGADYELRRNIILSAIGGVELDDFQGIVRSDTTSDFKLLGKYFVNRYVGLGATLDYTNRASSGPIATRGPVYDETRLTFSLILQR